MSDTYDWDDYAYEWWESLDWIDWEEVHREKYKTLLGYPLMSDEDKLKGFKPIKKGKVQ